MNITPLISPIESVVTATEPLTYVSKELNGRDFVVVIRSPENRTPLGFITRGQLEKLKGDFPKSWPLKECGSVVNGPPEMLHPDVDIKEAVEVLITTGVRPLLVGTKSTPVGVLEPASVFEWCVEHAPEALEELAYRISAEERNRAPK